MVTPKEKSLSNYYNTTKVKINLDHWSNSQDSDFRQCPLKWYRGHVMRLKPRKEKPAFTSGKAFHTAMEEFYKLEPASRSPKILLDAYNAYMENDSHMWVDYNEYKADLALGQRALDEYWSRYLIDTEIPKSLTEWEGNLEIPYVKIPFNFRIDVLSLDSEEPFILDFKTGKSPDMEKLEMYDLQLYRYFWAARQMGMPIKKIGYQIIKLPRSARGEIELDRKWIYPTKKQVAYAVHDMAMMVEEAMRDNMLIFPNYQQNCEWYCDFWELCHTAKIGGDPKNVEKVMYYTDGSEELLEDD